MNEELTVSLHKHFAERLAVTQRGGKQRTMRDRSMRISDDIVILHYAVIMLILCYLRLPTERIWLYKKRTTVKIDHMHFIFSSFILSFIEKLDSVHHREIKY